MTDIARPRRRRRAIVAVSGTAAALLIALSGCSSAPVADAVAPSPVTSSAPALPASATLASTTGSVTGGASVVIRGHGLDDVAAVSFGGVSAPVTKVSDRRVTVKVPAAPDYQPTAVAVKLLDGSGDRIVTAKNDFTYTASTPVARQLAYALTYWKNYNEAEYGNLNPVGGDCANFVSQSLIARGWRMNATWYNHDAGASWSPAWGYVPAMDDYFAANAKQLGLVRLNSDQRDKVALGDIGIFDWSGTGSRDHVQIVTAIEHVDGKIEIKFASHNDDYAFRDLDNTITVQHPGAAMHFWHLTK